MRHLLILAALLTVAGCGQSPMPTTNSQTGNKSKPPVESQPAAMPTETTQIETGRVAWLRNLDEAKKVAREADKLILLLFQEIPG